MSPAASLRTTPRFLPLRITIVGIFTEVSSGSISKGTTVNSASRCPSTSRMVSWVARPNSGAGLVG
ncbi:hypothetical protein HJ581_0043515 [Rhodococcus opacus]|nr:hypothetical protein HJ581_0043515 [Rhodococcus opacus]